MEGETIEGASHSVDDQRGQFFAITSICRVSAWESEACTDWSIKEFEKGLVTLKPKCCLSQPPCYPHCRFKYTGEIKIR